MIFTADDRYKDLSAQQKASFIVILLKDGNCLTTAGIAKLTGTTWTGAERMMILIAGVVPITKVNRKWQWAEKE